MPDSNPTPTPTTPNRNLAWAFVAIALAAIFSALSLARRIHIEQRNKAVGICMEMQVLNDLAASSGRPLLGVLLNLKARGLTGIAISEETVSALLQEGHLTWTMGRLGGAPEILERVAWAIKARAGINPVITGGTLELPPMITRSSFAGLSLGLNPNETTAATAADLSILARHGNVQGASPAYIDAMLGRSRELGADFYLPEGEQALGQRALIPYTAEALRRLKLVYVAPEFAKIGGDALLTQKSVDNVVRLHSIQAADVDKMVPAEVADRFQRAYRERDIRWLLVRPITLAAENPMMATMEMLDSVRKAVLHEGGTIRVPKPFEDPAVPRIVFVLIGLSAALLASWVWLELLSWGDRFSWNPVGITGVLLIFALGAACWIVQGRLLMSLVAAMAFPIAAYQIVQAMLDRSKIHPFALFGLMTIVSLVGGFCVAGLLNELPFYVRAEQFFAVKLAHFGPILVVGWILLKGRFSLRQILGNPVYWGSLVVSLIILGGLGFMLARTGNDNPAAVSGLELRFRGLLDAILYTRPRTKEFLIGHPALILGLCMLIREREKVPSTQVMAAGVLLMTLGAIGQTSIVNTLCHIHTPLDISLARIAIGLILGSMLGLILWGYLQKAWKPLRAQ